MAIDFPASPTNGQTFTSGSVTYTYDGTKWTALASGGSSQWTTSGSNIYYNTGSVGIGSTNPQSLLHLETDGTALRIVRGSSTGFLYNTGTASTSTTRLQGNDGPVELYTNAAQPVVFSSNTAERARIDSSGRLLVGTSSTRTVSFWDTPHFLFEGTDYQKSGFCVYNNQNEIYGAFLSLGHSRGTSVGSNTVLQSGDYVGTIVFHGSDGSNEIRAAEISAFVDGTPGTNDMPGRLVFSTTADGASSPTERMRITNAGHFLVAKSTALDSTIAGFETRGAGNTPGLTTITVDNDWCLMANRLTSDGDLVLFRQANVTEGTISVSGTTVSYNGAHLSRWSQLVGIDPYDKTARPEILRGTVMSNLDEMCDWTCPESGDCQDNEQLNKTEVSSVDDDPNVAGVFQSWDDDDDTWVNDFYLAMTGDFVIRIAAGTTVQRGDLLCSAGDGTARPQGDRYIKDSTIAKVTSTTVSCTHPDGSYCVPCVLMAC